MIAPDPAAHELVRLARSVAALVLGGVLLGALGGVLLAALVRLPAVVSAGPLAGGELAVRILLIGGATGAGVGLVAGVGAAAGAVTFRVLSHSDGVFVAGSGCGAAIGALVATANLLVSRDGPTWAAAGTTSLAAAVAATLLARALVRHDRAEERPRARVHPAHARRPLGR